jgi:hypothetical protein
VGPRGRLCDFGGRGLDTRNCFLVGLHSSRLVAELDMVSGSLGLIFFLSVVSLGCLFVNVTGRGEVFEFGVGVVMALTARPLG